MTTGGDINPVLDETNPIVRSVQAPFDAGMSQFYRDIKDANAEYRDTVQKLDQEIEEREEKLRELAENRQPETEPKPDEPQWDYDNPMAEGRRPAPSTSDWDYGNPLAAPNSPAPQRLRPPPVRHARPARADESEEDYSGESWLQ